MLGGNILTVTQLNRYVKAIFDDNKQLSGLLLKGEISNLSDHFSSGHLYFSLKDAGAAVKAVMFKSYAKELKFRPQNGQTVIVSCSVSVYERDGVYQLYVYDIQPDGVGALALALAQLKEKLASEGLFSQEHKQQLPAMPQVIGVVTSQTGAALQDILNILGRRYPIAKVLVVPVLVQGEKAVKELVAALSVLNDKKLCDVIIIGRGGGSEEDLLAFNSEELVRAVYASNIPIISAVGHETDFTLVDIVADERAPTPSAAAELVAPELDAIYERLTAASYEMQSKMGRILTELSASLGYYKAHRALQSPAELLTIKEEHLLKLKASLTGAMQMQLTQRKNRLGGSAALLNSLSPLNVLSRGYAIAFLEGVPVTKSTQLQHGEEISIKLASGSVNAKVTSITEEQT